MRGLDTNVLVRFVTQDDRSQAKVANDIMAEGVRSGERFFVSVITLCELVWVLRAAYEHGKSDIVRVVEAMLDTPELVIPHPKMTARSFVLVPLAEIAPEVIHPVSGKTIRELKQAIKEVQGVLKLEAD